MRTGARAGNAQASGSQRITGGHARLVRAAATDPPKLSQLVAPYAREILAVLSFPRESTPRISSRSWWPRGLRAVERYCELLVMAQGKPREPSDDAWQVTWEELVQRYQATKKREGLCAT